jgi:hypothetical protein
MDPTVSDGLEVRRRPRSTAGKVSSDQQDAQEEAQPETDALQGAWHVRRTGRC